MECSYIKYKKLDIDGSLISLESAENMYPYWCYPLNAIPIGLEGCILYCFIRGYEDIVFASNPETCMESNVYPLANNFRDFIRLILACGSANPIEQVIWMSKEQFEKHLKMEELRCSFKQKEVLNKISEAFNLSPMEYPYEYIKEIQKDFDGSKIQYSDEYYDVLGIEKK